MKVGIVCPYDWSHPGGVRTHIKGLASALGRRGVGSQIIAPASRPEAEVFVVGKSLGVRYNGSVARICFSASAKSRIRERLSAGDLDLLHVHEPLVPSASLLTLMVRQEQPVTATFHAAAQRSLAYAVMKPFLNRYIERVRGRIAVSKAALEFVSHYFPGRYRVIPNGVDTRRFSSVTPDQELVAHKPFVLFVGRPEPRKGFEVLREAIGILRRARDVRLVTTGTPDVTEDWIKPIGAVDDERLPGVYAAADIFCAPSVSGESFGVILVEAMAAGVPVIASDIPGYREAAGGAALLSPPGDPQVLAAAAASLLEDPSKTSEMVRRGRERAAALDWDVLSDGILEAYYEAAGTKTE